MTNSIREQVMLELGPIQKQWVAALRSGEYPQGRSFMVCNGKYCCLGVAAKCFGLDHDRFYLTNKSWELLGLRDSDGALAIADIFETPHVSLARMNDKGVPFAEIADYIEQNPDLVFTHSV